MKAWCHFIGVLFLGLLSGSASAIDECKIDVELGLVINQRHIRVLDNHRTLVQYNHPSQIIVKGQVIELTPEQQSLVKDYITTVQSQVPDYIDLIVEGSHIAARWLNELAASLHGENSENHNRVRGQVEHVVFQIMEKFNHKDENFYLGPQSLYTLEQTINQQFSEQMRITLTDHLNMLVSAVIDDTDDFKANMQRFGVELSNLSQDVVKELEQKSGNLDKKSQEFCQQVVNIDLLETQLQHQIPELAEINVFNIR
ncbi:hypothetical protein C2869_12520 [Saccharobesus litoralis]|uniref:DUF2884 family protein n=1 Tax=Saccharobesus litoralis TaxID=2172099 RepID=A0A2S0VSM3_9ALTE|nr:DUF2884 family protein [Saccharobesus litoralis]AWB67209.1 hypothetical protein C2869_12520 [Saccharobesus litoralis]